MATTITVENFEEAVINADKPVLVDFNATWCGPCRMLAPVIDELERKYDGRVIFGKCDVDEQAQLAIRLGIESIPTVILFKNGDTVFSLLGFRQKDEFEKKIDENL